MTGSFTVFGTAAVSSRYSSAPAGIALGDVEWRLLMATDPMAMKLSIETRATKGPRAMTTIHAHQLQPGDVLVHDGRNHQITRVDWCDGWAWPVTANGTGWAIALGHDLTDHRATA
jgi:hypothetical protein